MITLLHTGDWHIRTSQYSRSSRGQDFFRASRAAIAIASKRSVDAIFNTGDILNRSQLSSAEFQQLQQLDRELVEAGLRMFTTTGNHDLADPSWISLVAGGAPRGPDAPAGIIPIDGWVRQPVQLGPTTLTVSTLPMGNAAVVVDALSRMCPCDIVVYHGAVRDFLSFPSDNAVTLEQMAPFGFRLGLLGDIHVHAYRMSEDHMRLIGYPGAVELTARDEELEKKVGIITLDRDYRITLESEVVPTRKVLTLKVLTEEDLEDAVRIIRTHADDHPMVFLNYDHRVPDALRRIMACVDPSKAIVRPLPVTRENLNIMAMLASSGAQQGLKSIEDLLFDMAPNRDGFMYQMGAALIQPGTAQDEIIDRLVAAHRQKLLAQPVS